MLCYPIGHNYRLFTGYKFFVEGFIEEVWVNEQEGTVKAKCYHSQKKVSHHMRCGYSSSLQKGYCTCEVG